MANQPKQLPIPDAALHDERAIELVRVWAAKGKQHISLANGLWSDPGNWGICLVDLARHLANAYELTTGKDRETVLKKIKEAFDAEWNTETSQATGGLVG